jgi:hypothetical protein
MHNVLAIARPPCAPGESPAVHTAIPLTRRSQATGKGPHDYYCRLLLNLGDKALWPPKLSALVYSSSVASWWKATRLVSATTRTGLADSLVSRKSRPSWPEGPTLGKKYRKWNGRFTDAWEMRPRM